MIPVRSKQSLISTYQKILSKAAEVDRTEADEDDRDGYVRTETSTESFGVSQHVLLNSYPDRQIKESHIGLISRKTEVTRLVIEEQNTVTHRDGLSQRSSIQFVDDGQTLRVTESVVDYSPENFLDGEEQSYIIYQKSGKMRVLKPRQTELGF